MTTLAPRIARKGRRIRASKSGFLMVAVITIVAGMTIAGESESIKADGKSLYEKKCANCHGKDGKGDTPLAKALKAKNLNVTGVILTREKRADWDTVTILGKGKMPAYGKNLTPAEIQATLEYMSIFARLPADSVIVIPADSVIVIPADSVIVIPAESLDTSVTTDSSTSDRQ